MPSEIRCNETYREAVFDAITNGGMFSGDFENLSQIFAIVWNAEYDDGPCESVAFSSKKSIKGLNSVMDSMKDAMEVIETDDIGYAFFVGGKEVELSVARSWMVVPYDPKKVRKMILGRKA